MLISLKDACELEDEGSKGPLLLEGIIDGGGNGFSLYSASSSAERLNSL